MRGSPGATMSVTVEHNVSRLPLPTHFSHAEQCFSIKKRPLSSSSTSSSSSPARPSRSAPPPLPPSKGCVPVSRMFAPQPSPFTPLSRSMNTSPPTSVYDPQKQQTYFHQCFTNLGLLGRGSFGEVFKVQSSKDGLEYAVKRSAHRFRSSFERSRSLREARNHERLCPHPHILAFVAAWEESGRLYIQTELCRTSLLLHAESHPPNADEGPAWDYLCDLLSALDHMHSQGFVHLDLKPANVLMTESGRLKLADFSLLLEFSRIDARQRLKGEVQEGDPRYMAPELLHGEYGPAADVFSLGVSILELACNIEVPNGGEGWQQLRRGSLPKEFTDGLSWEFQKVLQMMLAPEPSARATVSELLSLPSVKKRRWRRQIYLVVAETALALAAICRVALCFGCRALFSFPLSLVPRWRQAPPCTPPKARWDADLTMPPDALTAESGTPDEFYPSETEESPTFHHDSVLELRLSVESTSTPLPQFPSLGRGNAARTPRRSVSASREWPPTPSSIHSDDSCHALTPNGSPAHESSQRSGQSQRSGRRWVRADDLLPRPSFEPKNLLSLFEETT